jgi:hypothetical protein
MKTDTLIMTTEKVRLSATDNPYENGAVGKGTPFQRGSIFLAGYKYLQQARTLKLFHRSEDLLKLLSLKFKG